MKLYEKILKKGFIIDQYMVHILACPGVLLRTTFFNDIVKKVLKLVPLTATVSKLYVFTINVVISNSGDDLGETLNHIKSLNLNNHMGYNVPYLCATILVDVERLDSSRYFKP